MKKDFLEQILSLHQQLDLDMRRNFQRSLPLDELFSDRWERANSLGWGSGSSVYDSCFVFGRPKVGENCWIGPFSVLDGSGGLTVGDWCTISTGCQIYSHDSVYRTLSGGEMPIERQSTEIGSNTYLAPYTIVAKGVTIGSHVVVGAHSYVNKDIPSRAIVVGQPAKQIGCVELTTDGPKLKFDNQRG